MGARATVKNGERRYLYARPAAAAEDDCIDHGNDVQRWRRYADALKRRRLAGS